MRKNYFVLIALLFTALGFGQISENFNSFSQGSYGNYSSTNFRITDGLAELADNARGGSGRAVRLGNSGSPSLEYIGSDGNGWDGGVGKISFYYKHWDGTSAIASIQIEYSIDNGSYVNIGTINNFTSTAFTYFEYTLNNASDNIKIRITTSAQEPLIIDDFAITLSTASCTPPSSASLVTPNLGGNSATLKWARESGNNVLVIMRQGTTPVSFTPTDGMTYTNANPVFGTPGSEIGTGTTDFVVYNGSGTSVDVTGLTGSTNYQYAVYEYATTDTCYAASAATESFTTLCDTVSAPPFMEDFEGGVVPPSCWTSFRGANNAGVNEDWKISAAGEGYPLTGFAARVNSENTGSTPEDWLVTPAIDLTQTTNNQLTFYTKDFFVGASQGSTYTVRVSTTSQTNIDDFTTIATYTEGELGNSYNQKIIPLNGSAYANSPKVYIAFVMTQIGTGGDVWFLDNVAVNDICTAPSAQATNFNVPTMDAAARTATLTWDRAGDGDNVLVVVRQGGAVNADPNSGAIFPANTAFGSGDQIGSGNYVVFNGNDTSITITNLMQNTEYHVAIYEYNNTDTCYNLDQLIGDFFVPCAAQGIPFTEDFESGSIPNCWSVFDNGEGPYQAWMVDTVNPNNGSSAAHVFWDNDISSIIGQDWLVTPAIDLTSVPDGNLSFFIRDGDMMSGDLTDYGSTLSVWVSTTTNDIGAFQLLPNATYYEDTADNSYKLKNIPLATYAGQTVYLAFVMEQDLEYGGDEWFLDDVNVTGTVPTKDVDTEVYVASAPIAATTIMAENTTTPETAADAFAFTIEDYATSDLLPTNVTNMRFVPGPNNTTDWTDALQGITLIDGNDVAYVPSTITISDNELILGFNPAIVIPNGTTLDFTIGFYLNEVPITNGSIVQFQINGASSGFISDSTGSEFSAPFSGGTIVSNNITIDSSTLNTPNSELNGLQIFSVSNPRALFVKGKINSKTTINLYDIQGRLVLSSLLDNGSTSNQVNVETLSDGIYVVKLTNSSQQKTKKVIIK